MSLDVFKVHFNLNKNRRTTCTASDLKRMLTIKTSSGLARRQWKKVEDHSGSDNNRANNHVGSADEILKSSRYHPDEQVVDYQRDNDGQQYQDAVEEGHAMEGENNYRYQHQQEYQQHNGYMVDESYNPFVQLPNNRAGHDQDLGVHPFDSAPEQKAEPYHQSFQTTDRPSNTDEKKSTDLTRRRNNVFSDWPIENCPRLLAMQQRQQQQQLEEQEQLDRQYQTRV
ncbi:hypothetical protein BGZ47_001004 [Haplosporangium gracile]|nr:hypothetical protein BGZ47_001004 [Haplosporangium gracile]